jgi:hypothetical protein
MKPTGKNAYNSKSTLLLAVALLAVAAIAVPFAMAADKNAAPPITVAQLAGPWFVEFSSYAACGNGTHLLIFTLNSTGTADDFADTYNTTGCGQGQHHSQTFTIETLNSDGTGTATFSNNGTPLTFKIQVNTAVNLISLVDVTNADQIWSGAAVKQ